MVQDRQLLGELRAERHADPGERVDEHLHDVQLLEPPLGVRAVHDHVHGPGDLVGELLGLRQVVLDEALQPLPDLAVRRDEGGLHALEVHQCMAVVEQDESGWDQGPLLLFGAAWGCLGLLGFRSKPAREREVEPGFVPRAAVSCPTHAVLAGPRGGP